MTKELTEKLIAIQSELKAPKGKRNTFGNYNYRSCEDILEAVKPILHANGVALNLSDEITETGGRVYVKATATLTDGPDAISVTAYAREAENKKGMDDSQITGTASSYARKYALNGLFCIDDTKDADTDEYARTTRKNTPKNNETDFDGSEIITEKEARYIHDLAVKAGRNIDAMCEYYGIESTAQMTKKQYADAFRMLTAHTNRKEINA